jgi:hypothetical protein
MLVGDRAGLLELGGESGERRERLIQHEVLRI